MKSKTQVVVIGGGLIGCSILYHLTKLGWSDVVLLERNELTSGSTWHAAAGIHGLHDSTNISRIQHYTMNLYKELEKETGQGCGIFQPGSLYLAQTEEREHQLRLQASKAKLYEMNFHEVSRDDAENLHPFVNFEGVRCIMWEPDGGNVDPSGVTNAYAVGARLNGAEIHRFTPVIGTEQNSDGTWNIKTEKGDIHTEWVVNAAGLWGREVGRMADINLPLQPTEHQYFVTDTINEIKKLKNRLPSVADRDGEYYLRQEGKGLLIGAYDKNYKLWAEGETPKDFGHDLFDDDLERIEENVLRAIDRVPIAGSAGIKRVINGPMIWSPDSNVLFGPIPEVKNYFCCNGVIPGFSQSGGMGLMAAEWIIKGETQYDLFGWDVARYGDWANNKFVKERVGDQYANRFKIHFPNEERSAGRPLKTRPIYNYQKKIGAAFGLGFTIGPFIGGELSNPASKWSYFESTIFETYPYLLPCLAASVLSLLSLFVAYRNLPESLAENLRTKKSDANLKVRFKKSIADISATLTNGSIAVIIWMTMLFVFGFTIMHAVFILYTGMDIESGGLSFSEAQNGRIFAVIGIAGILTQGFLIGPLSRKFGSRNLLPISVKILIVIVLFERVVKVDS